MSEDDLVELVERHSALLKELVTLEKRRAKLLAALYAQGYTDKEIEAITSQITKPLG